MGGVGGHSVVEQPKNPQPGFLGQEGALFDRETHHKQEGVECPRVSSTGYQLILRTSIC